MRSFTKQLWPLGVAGLTLVAAACAGNDAKKCKVSTFDDGTVRVACPGNAAIDIEPGEDSFSLPEECEAIEDPVSGVIELVCQGDSVALGECGLGLVGDLELGHFSDEPVPVGPDDAEDMVARFRALGCTRVIGSVAIFAGASTTHADVLERLEFAHSIRFRSAEAGLSMPKLRSAALDVGPFAEVLTTLDAPLWTSGGVSIFGSDFEGEIRLPTLVSGNVSVMEANGLTGIELPVLERGAVTAGSVSSLAFIRMPELKNASHLTVWNAEALHEFSAPKLVFADRIDISFSESLEELRFPSLTGVGSLFSFSELGSLATLAAPSLARAHEITLADLAALTAVDFAALRQLFYFNLNDNSELTSFSAANREVGNTFLIRDNPKLSTLSLARLQAANSLSMDGLVLLEALDLSALRTVNTLFSLVSAAQDVPAGLAFTAPAFERAATMAFHQANFSSIDLPVFQGGDLSIVGGTNLTNIYIPNLMDSKIYVELAGTRTDSPVSIDLSNFAYAFDGNETNRSVEIFAELGRRIDLRTDALENHGCLHIYGASFDDTWVVPAGQYGLFSLSLIEQGGLIDVSQASGLKTLSFANVGSDADRFVADFSAARVENALFLACHIDGAKFVAGSFGFASFEGYNPLSPATAVGSLEILESPDPDGYFSIRLDPAGDQSASSASTFDEIVVGDVPTFGLTAYTAAPIAIDISKVRFLRTFDTVTPNIRALNMASLEGTTSAPVNINGLPPTSMMVLPSTPAPNVLGSIRGDWTGQTCPPFFFTAFPNVTWAASCESGNVIEPG